MGIRKSLFKAYLDSLNHTKVGAISLIYSLLSIQEAFLALLLTNLN